MIHDQGFSFSARVLGGLIWFLQVVRQLFFELVGQLGITCKFIRHGVVILGLRVRVRGEMQYRGIVSRIVVPGLMPYEARIVRSKFGSESAIQVDVGSFTLLIEKQVLSAVNIVAA